MRNKYVKKYPSQNISDDNKTILTTQKIITAFCWHCNTFLLSSMSSSARKCRKIPNRGQDLRHFKHLWWTYNHRVQISLRPLSFEKDYNFEKIATLNSVVNRIDTHNTSPLTTKYYKLMCKHFGFARQSSYLMLEQIIHSITHHTRFCTRLQSI